MKYKMFNKYEKCVKLTSHQKNENKNHIKVPSFTSHNDSHEENE